MLYVVSGSRNFSKNSISLLCGDMCSVSAFLVERWTTTVLFVFDFNCLVILEHSTHHIGAIWGLKWRDRISEGLIKSRGDLKKVIKNVESHIKCHSTCLKHIYE